MKNFETIRQLLLTISILTLLKAQECSHARSAVMLRHLSLCSNLTINPCLIAPSDSVCLTSSKRAQAISVTHLPSTIYFNLSLIWHAMPTLLSGFAHPSASVVYTDRTKENRIHLLSYCLLVLKAQRLAFNLATNEYLRGIPLWREGT